MNLAEIHAASPLDLPCDQNLLDLSFFAMISQLNLLKTFYWQSLVSRVEITHCQIYKCFVVESNFRSNAFSFTQCDGASPLSVWRQAATSHSTLSSHQTQIRATESKYPTITITTRMNTFGFFFFKLRQVGTPRPRNVPKFQYPNSRACLSKPKQQTRLTVSKWDL